MSIKITTENYSYYKEIFEIFNRHLFQSMDFSIPPEAEPLTVLNRWEAKSKSLARKGLQSGLNDVLTSLPHYPKDTIDFINTELIKKGLPDINVLTGTIQKTIKRILKTGKITNIDEYYIIKEQLDDTTSDISLDERERLSTILMNYESSINR